jgi:3-isopropylmalate/(R)-2-methylmalate dehydratase large subunit
LENLKTDEGAVFDKEYHFDGNDIEPMITYGTNPGMGIKVKDRHPHH